jgi:malate dehydrogenase (oxaloacetate-decarboxylating)(NADP+)
MAQNPPLRPKRPTFTDQEALLFHSEGRPGKLEVIATKPMATQRDLSLAYSPGVAVPVLAIAEDESRAYDYTVKGNFVAVITNGTAILGLGNRGALAAKPVMEGKAVLFKRFADIDSIDIGVSTEDPEEFINAIKVLGKTWGGINLEDIKAPECFIIEQRLRSTAPAPAASPASSCSRRSDCGRTTSSSATPRAWSTRAAPRA